MRPDFPSADPLGLQVNEAQTAVLHDGLLVRPPGERVPRPDPVTPHGETVAAHRSAEGS